MGFYVGEYLRAATRKKHGEHFVRNYRMYFFEQLVRLQMRLSCTRSCFALARQLLLAPL
jgi:hypothetical protein